MTIAQPDIKPNPDPTAATNAAVAQAMVAERDYVNGALGTLAERLNGIDRATELRLTGITEIPHQIGEKVGHLEDLTDEKFRSVATQFLERDTRQEREARDNKVAVDAAFAAQKEAAAKQDETNLKAIDKSEKATEDKINKLSELHETTNTALGDRIEANSRASADKLDDMKERVAVMERAVSDRFAAVERLLVERISTLESRVGGAESNRAGSTIEREDTRALTAESLARRSSVIAITAVVISVVLMFVAIGSLIAVMAKP